MTKPSLALLLITGLIFTSCKESSSKNNQSNQETITEKSKTLADDSLIMYQTENLIIRKLTNHIYEHISYLNTNDFGKVACNGMLVVNENEGVIFDTPTDNKSSAELINFVTSELRSIIVAIVPTHFHVDCVGGMQMFEEHDIPAYATKKTIMLLENSGQSFSKPIKEFESSHTLNIGNKKVYLEYFGEGHTKDNIIGYFPEDNAIFGGCMIKAVGAGKGNLQDANTSEWSATVRKIKLKYPMVRMVIPGHGEWGGSELFDYTIELFK